MKLDGNWQVLKLAQGQPFQFPPQGSWEALTIPEDICNNATNSAAGKRAWYRRTFTLPESLHGERTFLSFQGTGFHALVYLNGERVGEHWLCYLPWEVDVTGRVRWGQENELVVGLESVVYANGTLPFTRYWNGGIYDSVYLATRPAVRVEQVRIKLSWRLHRLKIETVLSNETTAVVNLKLRQAIYEADVLRRSLPVQTVEVPANQTLTLTSKVEAKGLAEWWLHRPHLLTLRTALEVNGAILDEHRERFGYRDFYAQGTEFYLNGVRCPLRRFTACVQHWKQGRTALWRHFYGGLRSGFNSLRFHQCPGSFGSDVADEVGLLICQEGSGGIDVKGTSEPSEEWWRHFRDYWQKLADTCYNHPSVILYSLANERFYPQERKSGGLTCLAREQRCS